MSRYYAKRSQAFRVAAFVTSPGTRRPIVERLEPRQMLTAGWQNPLMPPDVTDDGVVDLSDAMESVRDLRANGPRIITTPFDSDDPAAKYLDVDGNQSLEVADLVQIVHSMRRDALSGLQPALTIQLQFDSGDSATDRITNDARVSGQTTAAAGVTIVNARLRFGRGAVQEFVVGPNGSFSIDPAQFGGLADGPDRIGVAVTDSTGRQNVVQLRFTLDTTVPVLGLPRIFAADDTGYRSDDGITRLSQPRIELTAESGVSLQLRTDGEVVFDGLSSGTFLQSIGLLSEGAHILTASARDIAGNAIETEPFSIMIDTLSPALPTVDLGVASDSGVLGDRMTQFGRVTLVGAAEGHTHVSLGNGHSVFSERGGRYSLPNVTLQPDTNLLTIVVEDAAGNTRSLTKDFTRLPGTIASDPVLRWQEEMLNAIVQDATAPPAASRGMALLSIAMLDVVNAIEDIPSYWVSLSAPPEISLEAAISAAARRVMLSLYPAKAVDLNAVHDSILAAIPDGDSKTQGDLFGAAVGESVVNLRATDGWNAIVTYTPDVAPGNWQPTLPAFAPALAPQWGQIEPFGVADIPALTPAGLPALSTQQWADALNEVKSLGRASGSTRTADQTEIARFWADGAGTYTPPGHWNQIAAEFSSAEDLSPGENARLFAALDAALADAAIVAWNAKYTANFWRPITAIRQADNDGNPDTVSEANWLPLLGTPPFPEYTSGHSTFSGAAAELLSAYFGDAPFSTQSLGLPGVTRNFQNFSEAANEASRSRIYGGIHYSFSGADGLTSGRAIAREILARFGLA